MASKSFTIFLLLLFVQASSWARLPNESPTDPFASFFSSLTGSVQEIPSMPCSSSLYRGNAGGCGVCAQPVNDWRKKIPDLANRLVSTDASIAGNANRSAQRNPAKVNGALTSFNAAGLTAKTGREASDARAKNADGVKNEFEKCREEIGKACDKKRLAPEDTRIASAVLKACDDAAKQAGKFADDKKKDGAGLGNLSDLMNAASKALGAMQPQGGQNQSPSGISQPEQANMTAPAAAPELQTSKFENKTGNSAASVAFGNAEKKDGAGSIAVGGGNFPMGGSLTGLGENGERRIASASTDLGAHGTGSGSGGGSGGGSAGLAGSGSSASPARVADLAAEPGLGANGSYDLSAGGGFRSVGLKPSKGDLAEVAAEGGAPALDETKLDEDGNKDPAAEAAAAEEAMGEDSDSIFLRVKQKYALLKGAGKI